MENKYINLEVVIEYFNELKEKGITNMSIGQIISLLKSFKQFKINT